MVAMTPGDTFMGMNLDHGGHLTHGKSINQSGKWFNPVAYGLRAQDHLIDYDEAAEVAPRQQARR
jgi:glycine hydroxymethyltransferase